MQTTHILSYGEYPIKPISIQIPLAKFPHRKTVATWASIRTYITLRVILYMRNPLDTFTKTSRPWSAKGAAPRHCPHTRCSASAPGRALSGSGNKNASRIFVARLASRPNLGIGMTGLEICRCPIVPSIPSDAQLGSPVREDPVCRKLRPSVYYYSGPDDVL